MRNRIVYIGVCVILMVSLLLSMGFIFGKKTDEVVIFAASSLTDVFNELAQKFEAKNKGVKVVYNFGSSGTLKIQIEQGAPADIFASAGKTQMEELTTKGLIAASSVKVFATNRLVVIAPLESKLSIKAPVDILQGKIIAIGEPTSVPAGQYSSEMLKQQGLWDKLQGKLVYSTNVRQVLQYVETGEADLGFVYATDALSSRKVKVLYTVPETMHKPIVYVVGQLTQGKQRVQSQSSNHEQNVEKFMALLISKEGQEIISKYGFIVR